MAPLPVDGTARVKVEYSVAGYDHDVQIRVAAGLTADDVVGPFNDLITALSPVLMPSTYVRTTFAESGSNIFNPVAGDWPVSWGTGSPQPFHTAWYYDFIGRSLDGRRVRLAMFGANQLAEGGDYRISVTEDTAIAAAVLVLNSNPGVFVSINAFQPVFYQYANSGVNAYWRNKVR